LSKNIEENGLGQLRGASWWGTHLQAALFGDHCLAGIDLASV